MQFSIVKEMPEYKSVLKEAEAYVSTPRAISCFYILNFKMKQFLSILAQSLFCCSLRIILHLKRAFLFPLVPYLVVIPWLLLSHPLLLRGQPQLPDTLRRLPASPTPEHQTRDTLRRLLTSPTLEHRREHKEEVYFSTLLDLVGLLRRSLMDYQEGE